MLINQKQLKKVTVETQSGQFLGYISDFELDTDTGEIEKYYVRNKKLIPGLFENNLMINKSQIIDFNEKKMIVEDAFVKAKAAAKSKLAEINNLEGTEPVITSQTNDQ
jgi:sporulation protein YlmC with PRC-barrel domain